jgi:hypothetical protein
VIARTFFALIPGIVCHFSAGKTQWFCGPSSLLRGGQKRVFFRQKCAKLSFFENVVTSPFFALASDQSK